MTVIAILMHEVPRNHAQVPETFGTTTGRPWLVDMFSIPTWIWAAAVVPAVLAVVLLFLDQNITTRLVNAKHHKLRKGSGYHQDLLIVGLIVLVGSLFGLPWIVAATVHSLNHVRSLATHKVVQKDGEAREEIQSVRENRVSPLLVHALIGVSLLFLPLVAKIPMSVLFGLFLFMGFATLAGNELFERVRLWAMDPRLYPKSHHFIGKVPMNVVHKFTAITGCLSRGAVGIEVEPARVAVSCAHRHAGTHSPFAAEFFRSRTLAGTRREEDAEVFEDTGGGRLGP